MSEGLIPPDFKRCQTIITKRPGAFQMGGGLTRARCEEKAAWLITETVAQDDGLMGQMTVCETCLLVSKESIPQTTVVNTKI